jgi:hypothetical protein
MKIILSFLHVGVFATALTMAAGASAQEPKKQRPSVPTTTRTAEYTEQSLDGDQVVKFTGDELVGVGNEAYGTVIRRPPGVTRCGLIRPRMNFVADLLKSVENL